MTANPVVPPSAAVPDHLPAAETELDPGRVLQRGGEDDPGSVAASGGAGRVAGQVISGRPEFVAPGRIGVGVPERGQLAGGDRGRDRGELVGGFRRPHRDRAGRRVRAREGVGDRHLDPLWFGWVLGLREVDAGSGFVDPDRRRPGVRLAAVADRVPRVEGDLVIAVAADGRRHRSAAALRLGRSRRSRSRSWPAWAGGGDARLRVGGNGGQLCRAIRPARRRALEQNPGLSAVDVKGGPAGDFGSQSRPGDGEGDGRRSCPRRGGRATPGHR